MDDFQTTSKLNLIQSSSSLHHSSTVRKNQILIKIFFSLIILLALLTGAIIINQVQKYNVSQQKRRTEQQRDAVRAFCSSTRHPDSCRASITVFRYTRPDDIFNASLQVAVGEVSSLTSLTRALILKSPTAGAGAAESRNESALFTCSSLIDDSLNQLDRSVATAGSGGESLFSAAASTEDREARVQDQIKEMKAWVNDAWRDLWRCFEMLGKEESTAAIELRSGVHQAIMYVGNIYDFLETRDGILEEVRYQMGVDKEDYGIDFEYFWTLVLFSPQYFVLVFLLCLFLRIY